MLYDKKAELCESAFICLPIKTSLVMIRVPDFKAGDFFFIELVSAKFQENITLKRNKKVESICS